MRVGGLVMKSRILVGSVYCESFKGSFIIYITFCIYIVGIAILIMF